MDSSSARYVSSARIIDGAVDIDSGRETLTVEDRLSLLTPSKEIINFYKRKVKNLKDEQDFINDKLEQFRSQFEDQHKYHLEIAQLKSEVSELQIALSNLQECFFKEQESNLKLQYEIKISTIKDKKSLNEQPKYGVVCHKSGSRNKVLNENYNNNFNIDSQKNKNNDNDRHLLLQIETLRNQTKEQSDLYKKKMSSLLKEKDLKFEEMEMLRRQDQERIQTLVDKLKRAHDLLYDTTQELARQREYHEQEVAQRIEEKEKRLKGCEPSSLVACSRLIEDGVLSGKKFILSQNGCMAAGTGRSKDKDIHILTRRLKDAEKLSTAYRDQIIKLEDELNHHRVESDAKIKQLQIRLEKTTTNLNSMTIKRKELDSRRKLDIEGYRTDILQLKGKLEDTEAQLFKLAVCYSRNMGLECAKSYGDLDVKPKDIQKTTSYPNEICRSVELLKLKIIDIENKLKQL